MERGDEWDACGAPKILFLHLDSDYVVGSIWENSSTCTLKICVYFVRHTIRKKFFDALIHYHLTFLPVPTPRLSQAPFILTVSALTEAAARKLILPGGRGRGVLSHHLGPSSNAMNTLKEALYLVPPTWPVVPSLSH